jgi:hypothetical protein
MADVTDEKGDFDPRTDPRLASLNLMPWKWGGGYVYDDGDAELMLFVDLDQDSSLSATIHDLSVDLGRSEVSLAASVTRAVNVVRQHFEHIAVAIQQAPAAGWTNGPILTPPGDAFWLSALRDGLVDEVFMDRNPRPQTRDDLQGAGAQKDAILDYHTRTEFTCGYCCSLAAVLHDLTGWPIRAHVDADDEVVHAWVVNEEGRAVDINGIHPGGIAATKYSAIGKAARVRPMDRNDLTSESSAAQEVEEWALELARSHPKHFALPPHTDFEIGKPTATRLR